MMNCFYSTKCYKQNVILVQFNGKYNKEELIEYVDKNYPHVSYEIINIINPENLPENVEYGWVTLKIN